MANTSPERRTILSQTIHIYDFILNIVRDSKILQNIFCGENLKLYLFNGFYAGKLKVKKKIIKFTKKITMRFYPSEDTKLYVEHLNAYEKICHNPFKSWKRDVLTEKTLNTTINHWRDLEGSKKSVITDKDLIFDTWPKSRLILGRTLPIYCVSGRRYIKMLQRFPAGFNCAEKTINLKELLKVQKKAAAIAKKKAELKKLQQKAAKEAALNMAKYKTK